jgi:EAL domain-containing protein (putative c-di-GMP-specific phosphodiesterase class I)
MMAELSTAFGMETVAEWVTDAETAAIVARLGMTYMQGFYFSQPVEACDLDLVSPDRSLPR